jgi:hypothetical protein
MSTGGRVKLSKKISIRIECCAEYPDEPLLPRRQVGPFEVEEPMSEALAEKKAVWIVANEAHKIGGNLAGGCLRDLILGKEIKDYDIFLNFDLSHPATAVQLNEEIFGKGKVLPPEATQNMRAEVKGLIKYHNAAVDIIVVDCPNIRDLVKTFDASICQVWTEKVGDDIIVFCSENFLRYMRDKSWLWYTIVPTSAHLDRLVDKFGPYIAYNGDYELNPVNLGKLSDMIK